MKVSEYFGAVRPSLGGSLTMAALVLLLKWALPASWPLLFRFGLEVLTGAMTYCVFMLTFHRDRVFAFWYLMQRKENRPV